MESGEIKRYYEWNPGSSRSGRVEIYLAEDDNNVWFESGRFVKKELFDSQLSQITEETYQSKESQNSQPPAPQVPQSIEEWEAQLGNPQLNSIAPPQPVQQKEKSAVQIILEKQKKFNNIELDVKIPLDFPNEKAIEFMMVMFDEDEVIDEIVNFVYSQMSSDQINSIIKTTIKERISNISENHSE
jgi:hypothetical protein